MLFWVKCGVCYILSVCRQSFLFEDWSQDWSKQENVTRQNLQCFIFTDTVFYFNTSHSLLTNFYFILFHLFYLLYLFIYFFLWNWFTNHRYLSLILWHYHVVTLLEVYATPQIFVCSTYVERVSQTTYTILYTVIISHGAPKWVI